MNYSEYLINWIKEEVQKAKCDGVVIGISGGIDSGVVAYLGKKAFPNNSLGVIMPISNMHDIEDAREVAKAIEIETVEVDLSKTFDVISSAIGQTSELATANIKPRLRMTTLYSLAQDKKYLVLGTDNAAEWILGYFTKFGDGGVDLLPIVHLTKEAVRDMAKEFNLPSIIITKKPSAGLWEGQTDEDELGFSYDMVDKYIRGEAIPKDIFEKIENQNYITRHKRIGAPQPKPFNKI